MSTRRLDNHFGNSSEYFNKTKLLAVIATILPATHFGRINESRGKIKHSHSDPAAEVMTLVIKSSYRALAGLSFRTVIASVQRTIEPPERRLRLAVSRAFAR